MSWGFLSFIILLLAGIFIWAAGEKRRRDAMPPEELEKLEADEDYGSIDEKLECIFCHSKNCVRTQSEIFSEEKMNAACRYICIARNPLASFKTENQPSLKETLKAHCMSCGNDWEFYLPEEKQNSPA